MRPVDECLESLATLSEPARHLRLRRLGDLAVTLDAPEVLGHLVRLQGGPCGVAARLARSRWRLEADRAWLRRASGDGIPAPDPGGLGWPVASQDHEPADAPGLAATAGEELDAFIPSLAKLSTAPGAAGAQALDALATLGTPEALSALTELTLEPPRRLAALVLHGGPSTQAAAAACLAELPEAERTGLLPFFAHLPGGAPLAEIDRALAGDEAARRAAAHALEGNATAEALPRLRERLSDPDPWTRIHAIESLGALAPSDLLELLPMDDAEPSVRAAAVRAAARGARSPEALLQRGLEDGDPWVRATSWRAWATRLGSTEVAGAARDEALQDPDPRVVEAAALACARETPEAAARAAQRLLETGDAAHVLAGIGILPILDDPGATAALRSLHADASAPRLRQEALRALGLRAARFPESLFALQETLSEPTSRVAAARALATTHPVAREEALATLARAIDGEEDDALAVAMTRALVLAGPARKPVQRLLGNLREAGGELAQAATWVRTWVDPEAAPASPSPVDPTLRGLDLELAWTHGHAATADLAGLLEAASGPARRPLVALARELAAAARQVGVLSRLAPLARRLRLKEALRCPLPAGSAASTSSPSQAAYLDWQSARRQMSRRLRRRVAATRPRSAPLRGRRIAPSLALPDGLGSRLGAEAFEAALAGRDALAGVSTLPAGAAPGLVRSLLGVAAGVLLALGLRAALQPATPSQPARASSRQRAAAPTKGRPSTPTKVGRAAPARAPAARKADLDRDIEQLAITAGVRPTGACRLFEERWMQLREWLMAELSEGPTLCTYTQMMQLRARHLAGDEGTHEELDGYLRGASGLLAERILQDAAGSD